MSLRFINKASQTGVISADYGYPFEWTRLTPGMLLPSYNFDGTSLSFDIADLIGVSAAEAHTATGDWRDVTQGLMMRVQEYLAGLRASYIKNCYVSTTNDFTYNHATLGNVLRRTMAVQFAFQYADAYIPDEA